MRHLLLDLNPYGGTDPFGMFLLFLKRTADVTALVLVSCFGSLFVWVVFQIAGDKANVTPIPKGLLSSSVANYRPISITSVLSNVF